jgi:Zn-dependent protease
MASLRIPFRFRKTGWVLLAFCACVGIALDGWKLGLPIGLLLVASLLLHEAGHILMALSLRVPVREFGLSMTGAFTRRAYATTRRDEILIAVAGPMMNLLLAIPLLFLHHIGSQLAMANLALGIINLLPIPASDGMRILKTLSNPAAPGPIPPIAPVLPVLAPRALDRAPRAKAA